MIKESAFKALRVHGEKEYPNECCGALLGVLKGQDWQIDEVREAINVRSDSAPTRYEIAPIEVIKIEREARQKGLAIAGFYHSHPDNPANWSITDLHEAHWLGCIYIITSIRRCIAAETKAYLLIGSSEENKKFADAEIKVIPA